MKKVLYLVVIAAAFSACSKKNNTPPAPVPASVVISGTTYPTVVIGSQTWTSLNYNGPGGENYNNSATDIAADGKLYTMAEAQAITLPAGWRLPIAADYNQLLQGLGGTLVGSSPTNYGVSQTVALELMSASGWTGDNGNNQLGFNARPVGYYSGSATQFLRAGTDAFFIISTTGIDINIPLSLDVSLDQTAVNYYMDGTDNRLSLRFVKDN
jgi:uncharacterized protein (TIGR02145 family)